MPPVLTDKRNWFDTDTATHFAGAAGSILWRTQKHAWILEDGGTYEEQAAPAAFEWLIANGHADAASADLPEIWEQRAL